MTPSPNNVASCVYAGVVGNALSSLAAKPKAETLREHLDSSLSRRPRDLLPPTRPRSALAMATPNLWMCMADEAGDVFYFNPSTSVREPRGCGGVGRWGRAVFFVRLHAPFARFSPCVSCGSRATMGSCVSAVSFCWRVLFSPAGASYSDGTPHSLAFLCCGVAFPTPRPPSLIGPKYRLPARLPHTRSQRGRTRWRVHPTRRPRGSASRTQSQEPTFTATPSQA